MQPSTRWFGWTALMLPLHMSEQLLFGIGELATLKRILAGYCGWFQQPDYGTVVLVAAVGTLVVSLTYGILAGGLLKEISLSVWALVAIGEIHHILETIGAGRYTPGTATAIPYVIFGALLMPSIAREHGERVKAASSARRLQQILAVLVLVLIGAPSFGQAPAPQNEFAVQNVRSSTEDSKENSTWQIDTASYLWLQGMHGKVDALGHEIGFKASPTDLVSRAKPGIQQYIVVQHKRLSITGDVLWTPIEIKSSDSLLNLAPAMLFKADYSPLTITPEIGYRTIDNRHVQIDGLAGFRYWRLGADFTLSPAAGGSSLSRSSQWVDPLVGARIKFPLSRKLSAAIQGDAGGWGVGSQLDYQVFGVLSYRIKPKWALDAGWRYMYTDYSDSPIHSRIAQSGLLVGITHSFKRRKSE